MSQTQGSDDWRQQLVDLLFASGDAGVEGSRDLADQVIDVLVSAGWQPPDAR